MRLAVHDSSRSRFIYGRDSTALQGRRLRLQSAEREPLPTIVASASPTCYKRSLRGKEVVHIVYSVHVVFWASFSVVLAAIGRIGKRQQAFADDCGHLPCNFQRKFQLKINSECKTKVAMGRGISKVLGKKQKSWKPRSGWVSVLSLLNNRRVDAREPPIDRTNMTLIAFEKGGIYCMWSSIDDLNEQKE